VCQVGLAHADPEFLHHLRGFALTQSKKELGHTPAPPENNGHGDGISEQG
jgi:hypothetical protein